MRQTHPHGLRAERCVFLGRITCSAEGRPHVEQLPDRVIKYEDSFGLRGQRSSQRPTRHRSATAVRSVNQTSPSPITPSSASSQPSTTVSPASAGSRWWRTLAARLEPGHLHAPCGHRSRRSAGKGGRRHGGPTPFGAPGRSAAPPRSRGDGQAPPCCHTGRRP
jgi:hypothetical protein